MIRQSIRYDFMEENTALRLEYIGKSKWRVREDFYIYLERIKYSIVIPKGFITDLASVPRIFRSIIPRTPELTLPSCTHDSMYKDAKYPRKTCDLIFEDLMILTKVSKVKSKTMKLGVRLFGWLFYKRLKSKTMKFGVRLFGRLFYKKAK